MCATALVTHPRGAARAAPPSPAKQQAAQLMDEGVARYEVQDYSAALDLFRRANVLYPSSKIQINIADALKELGRQVEAAEAYDQFLGTAVAQPEISEEKIAAARAELTRLLGRVGRIRLDVQPGDSTLFLDGVAVGLSSARRTLYVAPGAHRLEARADGFEARTLSLVAPVGGEVAAELRLARYAPRPAPVEPRPTPLVLAAESRLPPTEMPARQSHSILPWLGVAVAAGLAGGGALAYRHSDSVFAEYSRETDATRKEELGSEVQRYDTLATRLYIGAGAAAVVTGILFYLQWTTDSERTSSRVSVLAVPGFAGGRIAWSF